MKKKKQYINRTLIYKHKLIKTIDDDGNETIHVLITATFK